MSANVEAMVREGKAALKAGRKDEARTLLMKAVELDPYNEDGWLWLSGIVDSPEDQRTCLENVLAINPNNQSAQRGLAILNQPPESAGAPDPIMDVGFQAAPPPAAAPPAAPPPAPSAPPSPPPAVETASSDPFGGLSGFASAFSETSVSWDDPGIATSSSSSYRPVHEPSGDVLDDWVSGLGLNTDMREAEPAAPAASASSPFTDISFGVDDDDEQQDMFSAGPFGVGAAFDTPPQTFPSAAASTPSFAPAPMPAAAGASRRMSPGTDDGPSAGSDTGFGRPSGSSSSSLIAEAFPSGFTPMQETDFRDAESDKALGGIPAEIKPTRIPGTDGERPLLLVAAVVLLVVVNVGAAFVLMSHLMT